MPSSGRTPRCFEVDCTVTVSNTFESLHAHVELDGEVLIDVADRVLVHGHPIHVPYGATLTERRRATVTRAHWLDRWWTKFLASFELAHLAEVSFSDRRLT